MTQMDRYGGYGGYGGYGQYDNDDYDQQQANGKPSGLDVFFRTASDIKRVLPSIFNLKVVSAG